MTVQHIEKIREILSKINAVSGLSQMQDLVAEVSSFFGKEFDVHLKIKVFNTKDTYSVEYEKRDKISIENFLQSLLAKNNDANIVMEILDLIQEGEQSFSNSKKMSEFISKAYFAYSGKIKFDKTTETAAVAPQEMLNISMITVSNDMVKGVITKLKIYANSLCGASKVVSGGNKQEINFQPHITLEAKNETNININFIFENARQQAEDEGLPDDQYKAVMGKLTELENIAKSKESKGKRWIKAKEIMKWLVEQGIQVAGILLPVLAQTIK